MNPIKLFFVQFKLYIILAAIALLVLGTATVVWRYKSAIAAEDKRNAVAQANKESQAKIDQAEASAKFWREQSDAKYAALMDKIGKIKVTHTEVTNNIRQEVDSNPKFYNQPLPEKGWEQWKRATETYNDALMPRSPASSPSR